MSTALLQQENNRLKDQLSNLQQELNETRKQLIVLKHQTKSPLSSQTNSRTKNTDSIEQTNITTNTAKNALLAKLSSHSTRNVPNVSQNSQAFKKYETMLKIGVDITGVITQMNKDNIGIKLIEQFKTSHGIKSDSITEEKIDLSQAKFSKYNRMKKLKIPMKTILNKMKQDGLSQLEMDVFSGKTNDNSSSNDPLQIAHQLGLPKKPSIPKPVNQMKRVHWSPVDLQMIKTSIWDNIDHQWFDYDPIMFELNFQTRKRKEKINTDALKGNVGEADEKKDENKKEAEQMVNFVDPKRSQMIQIGLRSFNMTNEQLRDTILSLDEEKLSVGHLSTLIDIVPTPEEQIQAEKASEDKEIQYFGVVERFFYSVYDVVELKQRLQKWLFKRQFMDRCKELEEQIDIIDKGKMTILRSHSLKEIFGIILAFGNHMNFGNKKGNAYGFHLNGLSLLPQIKTTDNTMTFPMFIWAFIKKKYPKCTRILQEFEPVQKASHIAVDVIEKEYNTLCHEMREIKSMINRYKEEYFELIDLEDMFLNEMTSFLGNGEQKMNKLVQKMDNLHQTEKELIEFFAYNTNKETGFESVTLNSVLKDVDAFIEMLTISKVKVKQLERESKKQEMRLERRLNRKKKRANTEHLTRQRFEAMLHKSKSKDKKKEKKDKKRRHRRKHNKQLHDKYKEIGNENDTLKDDKNESTIEADNGTEIGILQIETITLGDAVKKKGKSRTSRMFDRTKHSSFELFKRSHSKKKNIKFRDQQKDDEKTQKDDDGSKPHKHRRKQTQDDNALDNYAKHGLFEPKDDSDSDDKLINTSPGFLQSKSTHELHNAYDLSLPTHALSEKKDLGQVDSSKVQRVKFDDDGNVHNVQTTQSKLLITETIDNNNNDGSDISTPETPETPEISENVSVIERPTIALFDINCDMGRRNSDPGTPMVACQLSIAPSLSIKNSSFENAEGEGNDDIDDIVVAVVDDECKVDGSNKKEVNIDRTSNIRLSFKKQKKKTVKILEPVIKGGGNKKKGSKKKKKNKGKNQRSKSKPPTRAKSTRAAFNLAATFF